MSAVDFQTCEPKNTTPVKNRPNVGRSALSVMRELALIPVLVAVLIIGALTNPFFFTSNNLINILSQTAVLGFLVVGQTFVLLTGRLDLSSESVVTVAPLLGVWLVLPRETGGIGLGLDPYTAMIITVLAGAFVGAINGLLVAKAGLNPFIVTLAMLILLSGLAQGIAQGKTLYDLPEAYIYLGSANWLGIPAAVWLMALLFVGAGLFLRYHKVGRAIYATGGNEPAARTAGIRTSRVILGVYIFSGVIAAVAGILLAGRIGAITATQGQNLVFSVLAACVIGGINLNGGRGRLLGALSGVLLLAVVNNLLVLSNIASYWIDATYGLIILLALGLSRVTSGAEQR